MTEVKLPHWMANSLVMCDGTKADQRRTRDAESANG